MDTCTTWLVEIKKEIQSINELLKKDPKLKAIVESKKIQYKEFVKKAK